MPILGQCYQDYEGLIKSGWQQGECFIPYAEANSHQARTA